MAILKMIDLDLIPLAPFNSLTHLFESAPEADGRRDETIVER